METVPLPQQTPAHPLPEAFPRALLWQFLVVAVIIGSAGYFIHRRQADVIRHQVVDDLESITRIKTDQVAQWVRERMSDALTLSDRPLLDREASQVASGDPFMRSRMLRRMNSIVRHYGYAEVQLVDGSGRVILRTRQGEPAHSPVIQEQIRSVLNGRQPVLLDIHECPGHPSPHLSVMVPLMTDDSPRRPLLAYVLIWDCGRNFFPMIQQWPIVSRSAETLLVRKDGDSVLFLNDLRFRRESALKLRYPLSQAVLPAAQAVRLGGRGTMEGIDYRGHRVLASYRPVPGTPWYLVSKIDRDEAFSALRASNNAILAVVLALCAGIAGFFIILRHRSVRSHYRALARMNTLLAENDRKLKRFLDSGIIGVLFWDMDGRITDANDRFLEIVGYTREDLGQGRIDWKNMTPPEYREQDERVIRELLEKGVFSGTAEKEYLRKDGSRVQVLMGAATISDDRTRGAAFVLDISERKQAEQALRESEQKLKQFFDAGIMGIVLASPDGRILHANEYYLRITGHDLDDLQSGRVDWRALTPPEWVAADEKALRELEEKGSCEPYEKEYIRRDGTRIPVLISDALMPGNRREIIGFVLDITRLKQAQTALHESENRSRLLIESSPDAIFIQTRGLFAYANPATARFFGAESPLDLIGHPLLERLHPDYREAARERMRILNEEKRPVPHVEALYLRMDGIVIPGEGSAVPFRHEGQDGALVFLRDVSDRKRAEAERNAMAQQRQLALEAAHMGWWSYDPSRDVVTVDEVFQEIHGISGGHHPMAVTAALLHPEDRDRVLSAIRKSLDAGDPKPYALEYRIHRHDGRNVWIEAHGAANYEGEGPTRRLVSLVGTVRDITHRKDLETERVALARQRQLALDSARLGWWRFDLGTDLVQFDEGYRRIFGIEGSALPSERILPFIHGNDLPVAQKALASALNPAGPGVYRAEYRLNRPDGQETWIEAYGVTTFEGDGPSRRALEIVGTVQDITERKKAALALQRAMEDLERSNRELEQFAYVASHDLQEPLRMISSFLQLLEQKETGRLDLESREYIGYARNGAQRLQNLINDLLTFSRLESRGKPLRPTNLREALNEALKNLHQMIEETGATVTSGDLPTLPADHGQMVQLFQNLVGNALKFRGKDPPRIQVQATPTGDSWIISVRDNGIGIEERYFQKIFQRLHARGQYPGTGIGLALCQRIVARHGGKIGVESTPGSGSVFRFTLPNRPPAGPKNRPDV